jgi:hypothetical protein
VVLRFQRRQLVWDVLRLVATVGGFWIARSWQADAVTAVALHGFITALLYAALTWASWRAVRERANATA